MAADNRVVAVAQRNRRSPGCSARRGEAARLVAGAAQNDETARAVKLIGAPETSPRMAGQAKPDLPRPGQAPAGEEAPSLTLAQTNAVRAAFVAGVKPAAIARQFWISQAAIRQALAAEVRKR
jgi:hypothetical protein